MIPELDIFQVIIRIILSIIIGGLLGLERERKHRPAGFRTYVVVCLGSTLIALTNVYMLQEGLSSDAARIPAQVISGIGFLGAGTIMVTRSNAVKGLTTAASLWTCAAIGLALGTGFYAAALIGFVIVIMSLYVLQSVDKKLNKNRLNAQVYAQLSDISAMQIIFKFAKQNSYRIDGLEFIQSQNCCVATFQISSKEKTHSKEYICNELLKNEMINFIELY